jgi:hypothetical protein
MSVWDKVRSVIVNNYAFYYYYIFKDRIFKKYNSFKIVLFLKNSSES